MNKVYEESKRWNEHEVQEIVNKGSAATAEDVKIMAMLLDNLKDISIICAMEEESGYSERMMYDSDASYARGRGSNANRDSRGRYSSRNYGYGSYENIPYDNVRNSYEGREYGNMGQNGIR